MSKTGGSRVYSLAPLSVVRTIDYDLSGAALIDTDISANNGLNQRT